MASSKIPFRTAYDGVRFSSAVNCSADSRTKQSFKAECDINTIMRKYESVGAVSHLASVQGRYGDFIDAPDYQTALNEIIAAQEAFASLPSSIRKRFGNDPAAFLDFAQNPDNLDELRDLGLAHPASKAPEEPVPSAEGVTPTSSAQSAETGATRPPAD